MPSTTFRSGDTRMGHDTNITWVVRCEEILFNSVTKNMEIIMKADLKRKVFLGIGRFMLPLPLALIKKAINGTADNICRITANVSEDERRVHRFVVMAITETNEPVTSEHIAAKLEMPLDRVKQIVNMLEEMKVFFYRYNSEGINWAYPVTTENVAHKMTFSTGKQCRAA
jgi:hypothetical protein